MWFGAILLGRMPAIAAIAILAQVVAAAQSRKKNPNKI
jgi:xanthine/CO dehydrogenase XdhC/CoxF family maturation factor